MKKIPLGLGKYAIVDNTDYDWLNQYMWYSGSGGYVNNDIKHSLLCNVPLSPIYTMSRMILGLEPEDKRQADHRNHNVSDNRRENLRVCTASQNQMNRNLTQGTSSRFKGVYWHKQAKKWQAQITIDGLTKNLGSFSKEKYAAHAYNLAATRHFKDFAFLNKI